MWGIGIASFSFTAAALMSRRAFALFNRMIELSEELNDFQPRTSEPD